MLLYEDSLNPVQNYPKRLKFRPLFHIRRGSLGVSHKPSQVESTVDSVPVGLYISSQRGVSEVRLPLARHFFSKARAPPQDSFRVEKNTSRKVDNSTQASLKVPTWALHKSISTELSDKSTEKITVAQIESFMKGESRNVCDIGVSRSQTHKKTELPFIMKQYENNKKRKKKRRILTKYDLALDAKNPAKSQERLVVFPVSPHNAKKYFKEANMNSKRSLGNRRSSVEINNTSKVTLPAVNHPYFRETIVELKNHRLIKNPLLRRNKNLSKRYKSSELYLTSYNSNTISLLT